MRAFIFVPLLSLHLDCVDDFYDAVQPYISLNDKLIPI